MKTITKLLYELSVVTIAACCQHIADKLRPIIKQMKGQ